MITPILIGGSQWGLSLSLKLLKICNVQWQEREEENYPVLSHSEKIGQILLLCPEARNITCWLETLRSR